MTRCCGADSEQSWPASRVSSTMVSSSATEIDRTDGLVGSLAAQVGQRRVDHLLHVADVAHHGARQRLIGQILEAQLQPGQRRPKIV